MDAAAPGAADRARGEENWVRVLPALDRPAASSNCVEHARAIHWITGGDSAAGDR
jgi:hypothetical protein